MELICKYTVDEVTGCETVAFVWSDELLVKQNINDYNLGYSKFTNVTKVKSTTSEPEKGKKFEFKPSGEGYNYILFLDTSDEVVGYSRLQSQLNFNKYTIELMTVYLRIVVNDLGLQEIQYDYDYSVHIARTSEVHKQLFDAGYQNKAENIDGINDIDEIGSVTVQQLYEFRTNNERLTRYSGTFFQSKVEEVFENDKEVTYLTLMKLKPLEIRVPSQVSDANIWQCDSVFVKEGIKYGIFENLTKNNKPDLKLVNFETNSVTSIDLNGSTPQEVFGSIIVTDKWFQNLITGSKVQYGNLKVICNHSGNTAYTASEDSKFISGKLLNLLLQNNYSQSVNRIASISDSYILYKQNRNYTLVSHGASVFIGELKKFIYITNKLFMAIMQDNTYKVFELQYDRDLQEYKFKTIELGYSYRYLDGDTEIVKYYFKYIDIFAKNKYTHPFMNIQPFSFEGSLFTLQDGSLLSL